MGGPGEVAEQTGVDNEAKYLARRLHGFLATTKYTSSSQTRTPSSASVFIQPKITSSCLQTCVWKRAKRRAHLSKHLLNKSTNAILVVPPKVDSVYYNHEGGLSQTASLFLFLMGARGNPQYPCVNTSPALI